MGILGEDVVLIRQGSKTTADPAVISVNCPDKAGLGCDLCRIILEFGLQITRADFSTDGIWCYVVFWVVQSSQRLDWDSLKNRLIDVCPPCLVPFYKPYAPPPHSSLYLLKFCCHDRKGLLHDVTEVLTELEFTIQRVKVMTTPDGRVVDLFLITDGRELLHTKNRRDETCDYLASTFREHCISCELQLAGPEYETLQTFSSLPSTVAEELFSPVLPEKESCARAPDAAATALKKAVITVDNLMSPAHTLFQIQCIDHKCLFYDILRTSKDFDMRIAHGRVMSSVKGYRNMDLFVQQKDGKKITDPNVQVAYSSHLKEEMLHPLHVIIANRGPDAELLVANPVELCGKGRPRVLYDVTLALKKLGICIFSAEIGRHSTQERQWEVYRFLLDEDCHFQLESDQARRQIVEMVRKTLMGW